MNKFQLVRANVSDVWFDFKNQVKGKFSPSEETRAYTRELFSTVTRGWVAWQVFIIAINLLGSVISLFEHEWNQAFLYFLIAGLFFLLAFDHLMLNFARKVNEQLLGIAHSQQKTMNDMLDDFEMIAGTDTKNGEFD